MEIELQKEVIEVKQNPRNWKSFNSNTVCEEPFLIGFPVKKPIKFKMRDVGFISEDSLPSDVFCTKEASEDKS